MIGFGGKLLSGYVFLNFETLLGVFKNIFLMSLLIYQLWNNFQKKKHIVSETQ